MKKDIILKENYDKFIFKGSLALETYHDITGGFKDLFDNFNNNLKKYRLLEEENDKEKEKIVNELLDIFNTIGIDNFIIYDDGDVNYNYKMKGDN